MLISLLGYLALGIVGAYLVGYIWDHVCYFFQKKVIPHVRRFFGNAVADVLANIIAFANNVFTMPRRAVRATWNWFRYNVVKMFTTYDRQGDYVVVTDTIIQRNGDEQFRKFESQERVHWLELPTNVCVELDELGKRGRISIDTKEILEEKFVG
ncbi:MAG: hypothetical protein K6C40_15750 [Thermoguttaceae bacterium]|nr:hypothetical protein [Thermoguttaceae bacterium]